MDQKLGSKTWIKNLLQWGMGVAILFPATIQCPLQGVAEREGSLREAAAMLLRREMARTFLTPFVASWTYWFNVRQK